MLAAYRAAGVWTVFQWLVDHVLKCFQNVCHLILCNIFDLKTSQILPLGVNDSMGECIKVHNFMQKSVV